MLKMCRSSGIFCVEMYSESSLRVSSSNSTLSVLKTLLKLYVLSSDYLIDDIAILFSKNTETFIDLRMHESLEM